MKQRNKWQSGFDVLIRLTNWSYFSSNNSISVPLDESLPLLKSTTELSMIFSMMSRTLAPLLESFWTPAIMPLGLIGFKMESNDQWYLSRRCMNSVCRNPAGILCHLLWPSFSAFVSDHRSVRYSYGNALCWCASLVPCSGCSCCVLRKYGRAECEGSRDIQFMKLFR